MDCETSLVKYILFIFNAVVSVISALMIISGVMLLNTIGKFEVQQHEGFPAHFVIAILLITIGSIAEFISFLGCCGAIRESVCLLTTYAMFLLMLLIVQVSVAVLLWSNKDKMTEVLGKVVDEAWENRRSGIFEGLQKSLNCCGKSSAADYLGDFLTSYSTLPASCCEHENCLIVTNIYGGCRQKFVDTVSGGSDHTRYIGIGLVVVELVGFIFACCLANNVRNFKRRNAY